MEASILKVIGQVAGIGGISIGVLLIIFRNIIRKNIFPKFKNEEAYKIIRLIIILTFVIAVLGIIAWFFTLTKTGSEPLKVELVGNQPIENSSTTSKSAISNTNYEKIKVEPIYLKAEKILDVIIQNNDSKSIYITSIELELEYFDGLKHTVLPFSGNFSAPYKRSEVENYRKYEKTFSFNKKYDVRFGVEPHGLDRYVFKFDLNENNLFFPNYKGMYLLKVIIVYNGQETASNTIQIAHKPLSQEQND